MHIMMDTDLIYNHVMAMHASHLLNDCEFRDFETFEPSNCYANIQ